jgi:DDE superfamily endonuclease
MLHLPRPIIKVLHPFAAVFRERTWDHAQVLLVGAILAPGQRTVTAALRIMGLSHEPHFQNYHRVLSRASWSSRRLSELLLMLLLRAFVPDDAPVVVGIDETIERRRGRKIAARGIYRDPVRSSKEHFVKTSGLRWVSMQLLAPIPWCGRVWALPFFTVLAPSERYHLQRGKRHKKVTDWGRQMIVQLRCWLPHRVLVVVADSTYAVIELLAASTRLPEPVTIVTRLRLDAALYDPAPPRASGSTGRPRVKGERQPTLEQRLRDPATVWERVSVRWYGGHSREVELSTGTAVWYHSGMTPVPLRWVLIHDPQGEFEDQALLCTDLAVAAVQIVEWFVLRWQLEVTFHEGRTHLGLETQRQWSDRAIERTTPVLLALFSLVTLMAHESLGKAELPVRCTSWYRKSAPTFADALTFVRQQLWPHVLFSMSPNRTDMVEIPRAVFQHLTDTLAFAA